MKLQLHSSLRPPSGLFISCCAEGPSQSRSVECFLGLNNSLVIQVISHYGPESITTIYIHSFWSEERAFKTHGQILMLDALKIKLMAGKDCKSCILSVHLWFVALCFCPLMLSQASWFTSHLLIFLECNFTQSAMLS